MSICDQSQVGGFSAWSKCNNRIYSINRPGGLLSFMDLEGGRLFEVGAYSRLGAY